MAFALAAYPDALQMCLLSMDAFLLLGTSTCDVTIEKNSDICQIRLDFIEFSLAQPDYKVRC